MSMLSDKRSSSTATGTPVVQWKVIPHTPALVLLGYCGAEPAALIERGPDQRYRLESTRGTTLGSFETVGEAQASFERELRD